MIYILKGCKSVCALPGEACSFCADVCHDCLEGCNECCKGCCKPVVECVDASCTTITNIWDRPLGMYVFFTFISTFIMWAFCISALAVEFGNLTGEDPACEKSGYILGMLVLNLFIFLINSCFAVYFQNKIWEGLVNLVCEEDALAKTTAIKRRNVAQLIADSTKTVALYDFCFCFYFFFVIAQLVFNWWMMTSAVGFADCDELKWSTEISALGITYPAIVIWYSFAWCCFLQCHSACETCLTTCGGCTCCFGKRPSPNAPNTAVDDDDVAVTGILIPPNQQGMQQMPVGAKQKKKKKKGGCDIM